MDGHIGCQQHFAFYQQPWGVISKKKEKRRLHFLLIYEIFSACASQRVHLHLQLGWPEHGMGLMTFLGFLGNYKIRFLKELGCLGVYVWWVHCMLPLISILCIFTIILLYNNHTICTYLLIIFSLYKCWWCFLEKQSIRNIFRHITAVNIIHYIRVCLYPTWNAHYFQWRRNTQKNYLAERDIFYFWIIKLKF